MPSLRRAGCPSGLDVTECSVRRWVGAPDRLQVSWAAGGAHDLWVGGPLASLARRCVGWHRCRSWSWTGCWACRITAQVAADLIALDARLDRLERSPRHNGWVVGHSHPEGASGQPLPVALDRTLSYPSAADESLELAVEVWHLDADDLLVEVTIEVYCFCDGNHHIHRAAEKEWICPLRHRASGCPDRGVTSAEAWSALGLDADQWRARVGLPNRR